jgi:CubicO group peptidase (beta-lactamase class C family)
VEGGDAALKEITVRRLLAQRSGLPDYYEGRTVDGAPNVAELLVEAPDRIWTPRLLLDYTKRHYEAAGLPGELFLYADTNYDLLGFIVESATGQAFHEVLDERILLPLKLENTWMHARSDAAYADVWFEDHNVAGTPATSLDWAGGGVATTAEDLRRYLRSLLEGQPVSLDSLQAEWSEEAIARGIDYGYGLWRIRPDGLFFLFRDYPELIGASGSTGSFLYWAPEYDAVIAGTFNQTGFQRNHVAFLIRVLTVLRQTAAAGVSG